MPIPKLSSQASNIPLLSGQIVAQLNALLFSIHGLNDKKVETKVKNDAMTNYKLQSLNNVMFCLNQIKWIIIEKKIFASILIFLRDNNVLRCVVLATSS